MLLNGSSAILGAMSSKVDEAPSDEYSAVAVVKRRIPASEASPFTALWKRLLD